MADAPRIAPALDQMSEEHRQVFVRMLAAAALAHALNDTQTEESPAQVQAATGREIDQRAGSDRADCITTPT